MGSAPKPKAKSSRRNIATLLVVVFLAVTILPAFVAFALTPRDALVVKSVQAWNGCAYSVRPGDNLFRIGARYGVNYQYIAQMNDLSNPNYVWAGQVLSVPCGQVPPLPYFPHNNRPGYATPYPPYQCPWCQPFAIPTTNCNPSISYTVQAGDNLFRIAVNNGSTIQWIKTANNLWGKVLRPGVTLQIPCPGYVTYGPNIATPTPGGPPIITATPQPPTLVPPPTQVNTQIHMVGGQFQPSSLTVTVGNTVIWFNAEPPGGPSYQIVSGQPGQPDGNFSSPSIPPGGQYQFTFTTGGTYPYYASSNPTGMTGQINVQP